MMRPTPYSDLFECNESHEILNPEHLMSFANVRITANRITKEMTH